MAQLNIIFADNALFQLHEILEKYRLSTGATARSKGIYEKIKEKLLVVGDQSTLWLKTAVDNVFAIYLNEYILFFEREKDKLYVLKIWDCSRK